MIPVLIPTIVFLAAIPVLVRALVLRDRLFAGLYQSHRELWMQLGRPNGWMWRAPGGSWFPEMRISFGMLKSASPMWLSKTPELQDQYFSCRRMVRLWNFAAMPLFVAAIIISLVLTK
jgi:hypothetical protein